MDLPIPSHLNQYLTPFGDNNSEYEVTGKIKCSCGNDTFEVFESNDCQIIKLSCSKCGKEILLFDAGKHGWNGFVCDEEEYIDRTLPFNKYYCPECGENICSIRVCISSQGKDDFIEECVSFDDSFSADEWIEAFESIAVSLYCKNCNFTDENWIALETM